VQDQGQGLSPQELEQLFQPFVTGQARGTFGERSTGLGLAIAKRIVDGHQGRLVVSSSPGAGSTFTVRLPRPPREGA
jgi:two-component system sensor histidine kinase/response regulator